MATSRIHVPVRFGFWIAFYGLAGIPSSLFVIMLVFDSTSWRSGIQSTGFSEILFFWAVGHIVLSAYLIYGGLKMIKDTEVIKKCSKCNQEKCICE